jgi:phage baseplate assembly protein W
VTNFLGVGFKFPFSVGPSGGIQLSKYERNIEESVRIIIGTALGERQMRPTWGCRIHDFVFAPNNASTQTLVAFHVEEALVKYEFRVTDIEVEAMADPDQAERILVEVRYLVRATNSIHNLVFPFYLTGS